jgi:hypothetical protein
LCVALELFSGLNSPILPLDLLRQRLAVGARFKHFTNVRVALVDLIELLRCIVVQTLHHIRETNDSIATNTSAKMARIKNIYNKVRASYQLLWLCPDVVSVPASCKPS